MDISKAAARYPAGKRVRLKDDSAKDEPRVVDGYRCMGGWTYLLFEDGYMALPEMVAEEKPARQKNRYTQKEQALIDVVELGIDYGLEIALEDLSEYHRLTGSTCRLLEGLNPG